MFTQKPTDLESLNLTHFIDVQEIQNFQNLFSNTLGISSIITTLGGAPITESSNSQHFCNLLIDKSIPECVNCLMTPTANVQDSTFICSCKPAGLLKNSVPILIKGNHIANWIIRQVRPTGILNEEIDALLNKSGVDIYDSKLAYAQLPEMTLDKFDNITNTLSVFAGQLGQMAQSKFLPFNKEVASQFTEKHNTILNEMSTKDHASDCEMRCQKLLGDLDAGVIVHAPDSSIIFANPRATDTLGLISEFNNDNRNIGLYCSFLDENGELLNFADYPVTKIIRDKGALLHKIVGVKKHSQNEISWLMLNGDPLFDTLGAIKEIVISFIDITERKKMKDILIENDKYLRDTQQIARIGSYTLDLVNFRWTSTEFLNEIFGVDASFEKNYDNWISIIHPEWQSEMAIYFSKHVIQDKQKFDKIYKILRLNDNEEKWVHGKGELIFDSENQPIKLIGVIQDISDSLRAEELLKISEYNYKEIFENVQDVFFQIDLDGIIKEVSPSVSFITGFDREHLLKSNVLNLYKNPATRAELLKNIYEQGELRDYEIELVSKSGETRIGALNARLIKDDSGNYKNITGTIRDITKRKNAERKLRESESKFHDYIFYAPHGIFVANEQGRYIEVNSAGLQIAGYPENELLGLNPLKLVARESFELFKSHTQHVRQFSYSSDEFTIIKKNGEKCNVSIDTVKLNNERFLSYVVDITKRKSIEAALQINEAFLRATQAISQLGTFKIDFTSGQCVFSDILKTILGIEFGFDCSIGKLLEIIQPDTGIEILNYFENEVVAKKNTFDKRIKLRRVDDNKLLWLHVLGEVEYSSDGVIDCMIGTARDITKRKNLADELRKSESLYRSILNASPDAIIVAELNGDIRMVSSAARTLYGADFDRDLLGHNIYDFFIKSDRRRAISNSELMFEEFIGTAEYQIKPVQGLTFYAEVNGDVIWGIDGHPSGLVFVIRDISDRKVAENSLKESQQQIKKFAAHLQNVREEEKIMLAREIHDELGQILIALKIDMGLLKQNVLKTTKNNVGEDILSKFDNIFGIVDSTIKTTRKIMTDLRPEILYMLGFLDALKFYTKQFEARNNIKLLLKTIDEVNLNTDQSVALFRIYQEALTNIIKHAGATEVKVSLEINKSELIFSIQDNGVGFDIGAKSKKDSYGLIGIRERVFLLEGKLEITGKVGFGTKITVSMPYVNIKILNNKL